jgi:hypothetical protein
MLSHRSRCGHGWTEPWTFHVLALWAGTLGPWGARCDQALLPVFAPFWIVFAHFAPLTHF